VAACGWMALLEAPWEQLQAEARDSGDHEAEARGASRDAVNVTAVARSARPPLPQRSLRLGLTHLAAEASELPHVPERPLGATHTLRSRCWGRCRLRTAAAAVSPGGRVDLGVDGAAAVATAQAPLCVPDTDTVELLCLRPTTAVAADADDAPPLLLPPRGAGMRALRYARLPRPPLAAHEQPTEAHAWLTDPVGAQPQRRCDAAALQRPQQPVPLAAEAESAMDEGGEGCAGAWSEWCHAAGAALSSGDGVTVLRGGMRTEHAAAVRQAIVHAIPPGKRSTRVFSNMGCQAHRRPCAWGAPGCRAPMPRP
jgi:hypothetical protein